jgi:L-ascorbate metabolism protein UlaG (beta-lactamase superfamily)
MRAIVRVVVLVACGVVAACTGSFRPPPPAPERPDPASWSARDLTLAYLGHASLLIGFGGTTILTDPTFYDRIGVAVGPLTIGPKRVVAAALTAEALPALDVVLVTHAHMDSLDLPSLERLSKAALLVVPPETKDLVDGLGYAHVVELAWGQKVVADGVTIEAVPVSHWGRRWPLGRWRGSNGYLLSRGDTKLLFASDTAFSPELAAFAKQSGVAIAALGIGAYDPWIRNHESPEEAWRTFEASGAAALVPVHWDTFRLGKEPLGDAMRRLLAAAGQRADRVVVREIGGTYKIRLDAP